MTFPKPIRFDVDTWLVRRNDPVLPNAVIRSVHAVDGDRYLLLQWDLDPAKRVLRGVHDSLEKANDLVLYDRPKNATPGIQPHPYAHGEPTTKDPQQSPAS